MAIGRISSQQYFNLNTERMVKQQSGLAKIQEQLGTSQRVLRPSDDPLAMATALGAKTGSAEFEAFNSNIGFVNNRLGLMDTTLQSTSDVMINIKAAMLSAANSSTGPNERAIVAQELEGQLEQLRGLANTQDSNGAYIFSGTFEDQTPFQTPSAGPPAIAGTFLESATPASVTGRAIPITNGRNMDLNITGYDAFVDSGSGRDAFAVMRDAINELRSPTFSKATFDGYRGELDAIFDRTQLARTKVGVRMREAETVEQINVASQARLENTAAEAIGLDYAKAISELSQGQLQLQASQQAFVKTTQLSLFNFING